MRIGCGSRPRWSFRKSPVSCPERTPILVLSENRVTGVPPHWPSHCGVSNTRRQEMWALCFRKMDLAAGTRSRKLDGLVVIVI